MKNIEAAFEQLEFDDDGNVRALLTRQVEWVPVENGPPFREVPGTEKEWPAELVLLAMGWLGPEDTVPEALSLERDRRSNVKADEGKYATSTPGVFAAGDVRRGIEVVDFACGISHLAKGENPDQSGADMVCFETPSGGAVFAAGSMCWTLSLPIDEGVSAVTRNVLMRYLS